MNVALADVKKRVQTDYARVSDAENPWQVLGLEPGSSMEKLNARFEEFDAFYRADTFRELEDRELARRALQVRKRVNRAVVEIQAKHRRDEETDNVQTELGEPSSVVFTEVDPDSEALAEIYFRDGVTWLQLEDLESAVACFDRAVEHDPSRAMPLAYLAYTRFRCHPNRPDVREESRENLQTAMALEPDNPEVHALMARFAIVAGLQSLAEQAIANVRDLNPRHPDLGQLRRLCDEM